MPQVTDPNLLQQLNSGGGHQVTDPAILKQLNAGEGELGHLVPNPDYDPNYKAGSAPASTGDDSTFESILHAPANLVTGTGRGIAGDVVGLGELIPGVRDLSALKPGGSIYEFSQGGSGAANAVGEFIGAGLPLAPLSLIPGVGEVGDAALIARLGARYGPTVARLGRAAAGGAAAAGIQPTEDRSVGSHLENAALGAVTGAGVGAAFNPAAAAVRALAGKVRLPYGSYGGVAKAWENVAERIPGVRNAVYYARELAHKDAQAQYREAAMTPLRGIKRSPTVSTTPGHAGLKELSDEAFGHYADLDQQLTRETAKSAGKQDQKLINRLRFQRSQAKAAMNNVQELIAAADPQTGEIFPRTLAGSTRSKTLSGIAQTLHEAGVPANIDQLGRTAVPHSILNNLLNNSLRYARRRGPLGLLGDLGFGAYGIGHVPEILEHFLGTPATLGLGAVAASPLSLYNSLGMRGMGWLARHPAVLAALARSLAAQTNVNAPGS